MGASWSGMAANCPGSVSDRYMYNEMMCSVLCSINNVQQTGCCGVRNTIRNQDKHGSHRVSSAMRDLCHLCVCFRSHHVVCHAGGSVWFHKWIGVEVGSELGFGALTQLTVHTISCAVGGGRRYDSAVSAIPVPPSSYYCNCRDNSHTEVRSGTRTCRERLTCRPTITVAVRC